MLPKVIKGKGKKTSPSQMRLLWIEWEASETEVQTIAEKLETGQT
jgi:putative transposase